MSIKKLNINELGQAIEKWMVAATASRRIRVSDNAVVSIMFTSEYPRGRLQISMKVDGQDLFRRTPTDLKKLVTQISPAVASSGFTAMTIVYEEPVDREVGPFARGTRIESSLQSLLEPFLAFAHVTSRMRGHPEIPATRRYATYVMQSIQAAEKRLKEGAGVELKSMGHTVDSILDTEVAVAARRLSGEADLKGRTLSQIASEFVNARDLDIIEDPAGLGDILLLFFDSVVGELGRLLLEGHASLPLMTREMETAFTSREAYTIVPGHLYGDVVVRARVWSLAGMAFAAEILETEKIPADAAKALLEETPTDWKSRWDEELRQEDLVLEHLKNRISDLGPESGELLRRKHGMIDGRSVHEAILDAAYAEIRWKEGEKIKAMTDSLMRLARMPAAHTFH